MDMAQIKMGGGSSQYKFAVLSKIVRHMRHRHMEGEDMPLKLDEMLDETNQVLKVVWFNKPSGKYTWAPLLGKPPIIFNVLQYT